MEFSSQAAFKFISRKVYRALGRRLNEVEREIILGSLEGKTYKQIAKRTGYSESYLHHDAGPDVWEMLRTVLGQSQPEVQVQLQSKRRFPEAVHLLMQAEMDDLKSNAKAGKLVQGQLPDASVFFGRVEEIDRLTELVEECRCVSVLGGAGVGKSALVSKLVADEILLFSRYVWQPLRHSPAVETLLKNLNTYFDPNAPQAETLELQLHQLLQNLKSTKSLIILDSAEYMHQQDDNDGVGGDFSKERDQFMRMLKMVTTEDHQSCILLTSREPIRELLKLQQSGHSCKSLRIRGLDTQSCVDLLVNRGLSPQEDLLPLILKYRGEPLDLKLTASYIQNYCGGSVGRFLSFNTTIVSDVRQENLDRFLSPNGRLSELERNLLIYVSTETERTGKALSHSEVVRYAEESVDTHSSMTNLLKALEFLNDCSLLERSTDADSGENFYEVQPAIQKYIRVDPSGYIRQSKSLQQSA